VRFHYFHFLTVIVSVSLVPFGGISRELKMFNGCPGPPNLSVYNPDRKLLNR
jgi:hypothetical protein